MGGWTKIERRFHASVRKEHAQFKVPDAVSVCRKGAMRTKWASCPTVLRLATLSARAILVLISPVGTSGFRDVGRTPLNRINSKLTCDNSEFKR